MKVGIKLNLQQAIPYQGSKRTLAKQIVSHMPQKIERFIEPFSGSAALSLAVAKSNISDNIWINDINKPLSKLIELIINKPNYVATEYEYLWNMQLDNPKEFYIKKRAEFNRTQNPVILLYLLARCVKNAVRYNNSGHFNQSPDNRRLGKQPKRMSKELYEMSRILQTRTLVTHKSYYEILDEFTINDFVYLDPPYMGTRGGSKRYIESLDLNLFVKSLEHLNEKKVPFIISFDGKTGDKVYGEDLPLELNLTKILIEVGLSAQSTLNGNKDITYESLYLSQQAKEMMYLSNIKIVDNQYVFDI
ncbi:DNA adenine methylase [Staphylococcus arlettae]|uniref:Dam family site-specific DNA-(adenine-N6)-methyltransferase n=1 Tax=Staphylococcus arlettae TaxID=29378 RepID=UPI000D1A6A5A|nr:Dam family site-specific DNA-(adenine-N6)-methyltransferase [Staphylococcus arlettae]PTH34757.1 DNA adenine methylase [Staphylococcus arlettae]RIM60480.1 DNA adenine methylase [Staphylococcus arlettae]